MRDEPEPYETEAADLWGMDTFRDMRLTGNWHQIAGVALAGKMVLVQVKGLGNLELHRRAKLLVRPSQVPAVGCEHTAGNCCFTCAGCLICKELDPPHPNHCETTQFVDGTPTIVAAHRHCEQCGGCLQ